VTHARAIWSKLIQFDSLECMDCAFLPLSLLLLGLPPNLESLYLNCIDPSGLNDADLHKLVRILASHKCKVEIDIWSDHIPPSLDAFGLRRWAAEIVFWSSVDCGNIEVTMDNGLFFSKTLARIPELVAAVENHIAEFF